MLLQFVPDRWGLKYNTRLGGVSLIQAEASEVNIASTDNIYGLILLNPPHQRIINAASTRTVEFRAPVGALEIIPSNVDYIIRWNVPIASIILEVSYKAIREFAETELDRSVLEFYPLSPGFRDEVAYRIGLLLQSELLSADGVNNLYIDSLINACWIHIIRRYSGIREENRARIYSHLAPHILNRTKEYMISNFSNRISLEELASMANLSQSHFRRAFQRSIGVPPHQYLLKLRIEAAERMLAETQLPLSLVALSCGFSSQSHITRVMKQWRGVTPGHIRKLMAK